MSDPLKLAIAALRRGECVGMPTETVYGLAADALNDRAVARVFATKRRPAFDPLIVHITPQMEIHQWVELNPTAEALIEHFWPGPLTLLITKRDVISDLVTSGHPTVALRCPAHPVAQALLNGFGGPLVAPSANLFGQLSPTSADAVRAGLGESVSVVLDGGPCEIGLESTIVDSTALAPELPLLRLGGIDPKALTQQGYRLTYPTPIIGQAPGTLKNHYAPRLPLFLIESAEASLTPDFKTIVNSGASARTPIDPAQFAFLGWRQERPEFGVSYALSPRGDSVEAAASLFSNLRTLGETPSHGIIAELPPPQGLGAAIRDRLQRGGSGFASCIEGQWSIPSTYS